MDRKDEAVPMVPVVRGKGPGPPPFVCAGDSRDPMSVEDLATLADTSAVTLVAAMTTDAWGVIRSGIARLFGRDGPERQRAVDIQLDSNAQLVGRADDKDQARQSLIGLW